VTTHGFRDVIEIGRQNRSEVYNLFVKRPRPLVARENRIGIAERIDYNGDVVLALSDGEIARAIAEVRSRDPQAIAIGFLHAYANDSHERRIAEALRKELPGVPLCTSTEVDPEYREYERFSTAVVNAALLPILQRYIASLERGLRERNIDAPLYVMQSNGGMASAEFAASRPFTIIESGPASGVIAAAEVARASGIERVLSFDMGGTTAKAGTVVDGTVQIVTEFEAAGSTHSGRSIKGSGYPVRFPFVDLAEVSAGGGTIAWVDDGGALRVGPISAGADPGPACYGRSDRATVTDANVVLGRLSPIALLDGSFPIDAARSHDAVAKLATQLQLSVPETAAGIVSLVDSEMAKVLRIVTVERGLDSRDFTLVAYGGNGALHGCALAAELGVRRIVVPARPGVFSAEGLLDADLRIAFVEPLLKTADAINDREIDAAFERLQERARAALVTQGASADRIGYRREFDARYAGQSFEIDIQAMENIDRSVRGFHEKHRLRYGYAVYEEPVELVTIRLAATAPLASRPTQKLSSRDGKPSTRALWNGREFDDVPVYRRDSLASRTQISGPAIIEQYDATIVLTTLWRATIDGAQLILTLGEAA
ncbi:MAG: hydantoinase/oxoprolinase family protein, partial [Candidatus Eremiobacteraeota bacterium]|nr:hydantoinase/oxoprolinase family protein [Candidatus Eremiobacteraeota bacterium]